MGRTVKRPSLPVAKVVICGFYEFSEDEQAGSSAGVSRGWITKYRGTPRGVVGRAPDAGSSELVPQCVEREAEAGPVSLGPSV